MYMYNYVPMDIYVRSYYFIIIMHYCCLILALHFTSGSSTLVLYRLIGSQSETADYWEIF